MLSNSKNIPEELKTKYFNSINALSVYYVVLFLINLISNNFYEKIMNKLYIFEIISFFWYLLFPIYVIFKNYFIPKDYDIKYYLYVLFSITFMLSRFIWHRIRDTKKKN